MFDTENARKLSKMKLHDDVRTMFLHGQRGEPISDMHSCIWAIYWPYLGAIVFICSAILGFKLAFYGLFLTCYLPMTSLTRHEPGPTRDLCYFMLFYVMLRYFTLFDTILR